MVLKILFLRNFLFAKGGAIITFINTPLPERRSQGTCLPFHKINPLSPSPPDPSLFSHAPYPPTPPGSMWQKHVTSFRPSHVHLRKPCPAEKENQPIHFYSLQKEVATCIWCSTTIFTMNTLISPLQTKQWRVTARKGHTVLVMLYDLIKEGLIRVPRLYVSCQKHYDRFPGSNELDQS